MPDNQSLVELIASCKKGDLRQQELLYKQFYGYALGICVRYLGNRDDALEAANDSFIKVFKSINSFNENNDFKPWFRKVLVNTSLDYKRRSMRFSEAVELTDTVQQTTHTSAIDKLNAQDILSLMKQLNEMQRTVFNLYEIDGYSHKEIGSMLNIPESSSRTYLTRAKQALQQLLTTHSIYTK
ncbi:MAG: RNA polymerase sigma factor [Pedobacter sp.]|uniref:RNA polymerase sigma factor n=1 Tax=Pedobacter sp. TaxID=1411316 RepID=UPI002806AE97|nr:RNA polymerase sigma factor [Pedobacter sp.]MDQ8004035.1 RNA polymerase sigma factor [Pedobacter sp.]